MSIVHLNQIKNHLALKYSQHLDLSDVGGSEENIQNHTLSRSLSAFVIDSMCEVGSQNSCLAVTDGGQDNGVDAISVDASTNTIYVVQSKWMHSGKGEPSNADVKKFIAGIRDLLNCNFSRFNEKIQNKEIEIVKAMSTPTGRLVGCLAYTGINDLAEPSRRDLADFLAEVNDVSTYLSFKISNQPELYKYLTRSVEGHPINLDIGLKNWGSIKDPSPAYYGQVNGEELKSWWDKHGVSLLKKNIRSSLGDTEVNSDINQTIIGSPKKFWYFNNGITLIANKVTKTLVGGGDRDFGTFHCEGVSVVNGAQTLSTLGKVDTLSLENLKELFAPVRVISLESSDETFGEHITKANNVQNRIESRDFVSLDPEQQRLKTELSLEGISYSIKRDSDFIPGHESFDLGESTTALACASNDIGIIVQLKREVGRIWDDILRAPYTTLFHGGTSSTFLLRCVKINREIESAMQIILSNPTIDGVSYGAGVHGNRIIAGLVFSNIKRNLLTDPKILHSESFSKEEIIESTKKFHSRLTLVLETKFHGQVLPTLFKNRNKCEEIFNLCRNTTIEPPTSGQAEMSFEF